MKHALSAEQREKIRQVHKKITMLHGQMDELFDKLVEDIGFQEYKSEHDRGAADSTNPVNWLFDTVYNSSEEDIEASMNQIEVMSSVYHSTNDFQIRP